jgi:hypothetical protein
MRVKDQTRDPKILLQLSNRIVALYAMREALFRYLENS